MFMPMRYRTVRCLSFNGFSKSDSINQDWYIVFSHFERAVYRFLSYKNCSNLRQVLSREQKAGAVP